MENKDKPRICEVLGVEVGETFTADYPYKDLGKMEIWKDGNVLCEAGNIRSNALCYIINHPECIRRIRHWTPEEVELAKAIKVIWPEAYSIMQATNLSTPSFITIFSPKTVTPEVTSSSRFPSLNPGEKVLLSDIIGGDENG